MSFSRSIIPKTRPLDTTLRGSDFIDLVADAAGTGRRVELYTSGQPRTDANLIGAWFESGGVLFPEGWIRFDRVSDTAEALATDATGPDNTVNVDVAGNFSEGDIVTVWRRSTNAAVAEARVVEDIAAPTLTLSGSPFTSAVGDLVITHNEFGPLLEQSSGGQWVPIKAGTRLRWNGGCEVESQAQGDGAFLFMLGDSQGQAFPLLFDVRGRIETVEASAGQNSAIGLGWKSTIADGGGGLIVHFDGLGQWRRGAWSGAPTAPSISSTVADPDVAPGTGDMYVDWHCGYLGDGVYCAYDTRVHSRDESNASIGNLNGGASFSNTKVPLAGLGAGSDGPLEGVHFLAQLQGGGSLTARIKQIDVDWGVAA